VSAPLLTNELLLAQNVQPKATSPGVVQEPTAPSSGGASGGGGSFLGSPMSSILMLLVFFVPFIWLTSRRQKKEQAARASLKKGDRVLANGGIVGELLELDERLAKVKIAPGVTVQILASAVSPYAEAPAKAAAPAAASAAKDLKEAKAGTDKK